MIPFTCFNSQFPLFLCLFGVILLSSWPLVCCACPSSSFDIFLLCDPNLYFLQQFLLPIYRSSCLWHLSVCFTLRISTTFSLVSCVQFSRACIVTGHANISVVGLILSSNSQLFCFCTDSDINSRPQPNDVSNSTVVSSAKYVSFAYIILLCILYMLQCRGMNGVCQDVM